MSERSEFRLPKSLPKSPEAFRAKGWEVRTQIGVSGFRVDLGVVNPDRAGAYLAGIECDGATYHSSATARDRDKVRQAVLEGLGWDILRIWSTDWFRNPRDVTERLHERLEQLLEADRNLQAEKEAEITKKNEDEVSVTLEEAVIALDEPPLSVNLGEPYRNEPEPQVFASAGTVVERTKTTPAIAEEGHPKSPMVVPAGTPDPDMFYEVSYLPQLRAIVDDIVHRKGPLPLTRLGREVSNAHGWQRTGRRIMSQLLKALQGTEAKREFSTDFIWVQGDERERIPFRGLDDRPILEVSRTEIASVLDEIGNDLQYSEDPTLELARKLGISRLSGSARDYLNKIIRWHSGMFED